MCVLSRFSRDNSATLWTRAARLLCPWRFSRQEYWSGLPLCELKKPDRERQILRDLTCMWNLKRRRKLPYAQKASYAREGNTENISATSELGSFSS